MYKFCFIFVVKCFYFGLIAVEFMDLSPIIHVHIAPRARIIGIEHKDKIDRVCADGLSVWIVEHPWIKRSANR